MKSIKHPHSLGNIFLFSGFLMVFYSTFTHFNAAQVLEGEVLATCVSDGAYGQICTSTEAFEIEKRVKIKDEGSFEDKVTNVSEEDIVEFRVSIKNVGDDTEGDLQMTDILPEEMDRTGGDALVETWDDFDPEEEKVFIIEAQLKSSEFTTEATFEKCVVNKSELEQDQDFKGSDTATVCYNNADVELPATGPTGTLVLGISGVVSTLTGALLKRKRS